MISFSKIICKILITVLVHHFEDNLLFLLFFLVSVCNLSLNVLIWNDFANLTFCGHGLMVSISVLSQFPVNRDHLTFPFFIFFIFFVEIKLLMCYLSLYIFDHLRFFIECFSNFLPFFRFLRLLFSSLRNE